MLLKTRFYLPPLRKQSVYRSSLIDRLNKSSGGELVIITAPAGYGKSTLVSQWLHHFPHTFAWLTLDSGHNAPLQFWRYILNALQSIQPTVGIEAKRLIEQKEVLQVSDIVVSLLNDLDQLSSHSESNEEGTVNSSITLVLDDFHLLENKQLLNLINLFLDHQPSGIRLVITSREEPPLALARRRANNQLVTFNAQDLAFSFEESKQFFTNAMALELEENTVSNLLKGTEGWVAGLQLAALSLKSGNSNTEELVKNTGLDRHIEDYLFEEVFSRQSEEIQSFLIKTSLAPRFCAGLTNKITNSNNSQAVLIKLEQANLFLVPLDNHRTWYRYHDLFRQFLLQRFQQLNAESQHTYRAHAADWYEQSGYIEEAIDQHLMCNQWHSAIALIQALTSEADEAIDSAQLERWSKCLPPSEVAHISPQQDTEPASTPQLMETATLIQGAEPLTQREKEVLTLVTQGHPNKIIAEKLHISLNTLKVHIRNLYGKIGVENRTQVLVKMNQQEN